MLNRRRFLTTSAASTLGMCMLPNATHAGDSEVTIEQIEVFPLRYPMTGYFKFFAGPRGAAGRASVVVKITASNGVVGWGESVPIARWSYETLETSATVLSKYFGPALIGKSATDIEAADAAMHGALAPAFSTGMPIARAGLDLAIHDLAGKLTGKSLAQLWGRKPGGPITLSWTVNVRKLSEIDGVMQAGRDRGFEHFNIKVAPDPAFDVALAKAVRKHAPDCFLWADANGGYEPDAALKVAPQLADVGVDILEAPIRPNRLRGYQALRRQGALPILMDEGIVSPVELEEFIHLGLLDGVAMKHSRCGGLLSCRRQIELIEREGLMWVGSGLTDPDISLAAALGIYGAYGISKPAALNGPQFLTTSLLKTPLKVEKNGTMQIPTGPGLGIEVDEEAVRDLMHKTQQDG